MHKEAAEEAIVVVKRVADEGMGDLPEEKTRRKRKGQRRRRAEHVNVRRCS